jgi:hypothetical protein
LPPTKQSQSPSGSIHFYFQHPGFYVKCSNGEIAPGIDIKGDGGMVLVPPSIKPGKGEYKWLNDLPVAEAPQWLLDLIKVTATKSASTAQRPAVQIPPPPAGATPVEKAVHEAYFSVAQMPKGGRNQKLNDASFKLGILVGKGDLFEDRAIQILLAACEANGSVAENTRECHGTIDSGMSAGKREGRKVMDAFHDAVVRQTTMSASPPPPAGGNPPPSAPHSVHLVPMMARGARQAELWSPILSKVPYVERADNHPEMPDTGHPLRDVINVSIPGIMASGNTEALAVIHATHPQTAALVGAITTDIAARAMALQQDAENRSLTMSDYRRHPKTGEPERDNIDNMKFFLRSLNIEIRFNEWIEREEIRGWIWNDWQPLDDTAVALMRMRGSDSTTRYFPSKDFTWDALISLARNNIVDPARDLLDHLESDWDGVPRLATWLTKTCGVPDDAYHRAVGESMLRGLCARIRQPGCKYDLMTVFISERQGTSKSTMAQVLALKNDWFAEDVSLGEASKELVLLLAGKTVVEISEMRTRGEANDVKAMVSRTHDEARTAYSRKTVKRPRRNIFVGSTNEPEFLEDPTGGRRFLPVTVRGEIDLEFLRSNLAQLVGEAATHQAQGYDINIPREIWEIAGEHQEAARITSGTEELLRDWYDTPEIDVFVPSAEIVRRLADERQTASHKAVAAIMRRIGYVSDRTSAQRMWVKSPTGKYHAGCRCAGRTQKLIPPAPPAPPGHASWLHAQAAVAVPPPPYSQ